MHWGVFAISAAHLYLPKLPWRAPLRETSERMNFNVIGKKKKNSGQPKALISQALLCHCECNVMHPPFFIWYGFSSDLFLIVYSTQYICKGKLQWHCFFNLSIIFCLSCLLLNDFTPFEGISTFANLFVDVR